MYVDIKVKNNPGHPESSLDIQYIQCVGCFHVRTSCVPISIKLNGIGGTQNGCRRSL